VISGKYPADRFLMALLRACADAVVIGAGTLRATPGHLWTPAHVFPQQAESLAGLRRSLGRAPEPRLVVITAHGAVDAAHVAVQHGALIFTTRRGADACRHQVPASCEVVVMGDGDQVDLGAVVHELRNRSLGVLLTEGGPNLMGQLIDRGLLDEAFLTISPVVAGRAETRRLGMVEGVELLPKRGAWSRLMSVRRHGDYLFLRYGLRL
jgi:riboflavin biosynthesis pyrimidine reductase